MSKGEQAKRELIAGSELARQALILCRNADNQNADAIVALLTAIAMVAEFSRLPETTDAEISDALEASFRHTRKLLPALREFVSVAKGRGFFG